MYTITVEADFSAIHRLRLRDGTLEPPHGHDWHVRAYFSAAALDSTGMVADFGEVREALEKTVSVWHHQVLNDLCDFEGRNPTAEVVAGKVFEGLRDSVSVSVCKVEVTEAPGCVAVYEP